MLLSEYFLEPVLKFTGELTYPDPMPAMYVIQKSGNHLGYTAPEVRLG